MIAYFIMIAYYIICKNWDRTKLPFHTVPIGLIFYKVSALNLGTKSLLIIGITTICTIIITTF